MKKSFFALAVILQSVISFAWTDKTERGEYTARLVYVPEKRQYRIVSEFENDYYTRYEREAYKAFSNAKRTGYSTEEHKSNGTSIFQRSNDLETSAMLNRIRQIQEEESVKGNRISFGEAIYRYKEDVAIGNILEMQRDAFIFSELQRQTQEQEKINLLTDILDELRWQNR